MIDIFSKGPFDELTSCHPKKPYQANYAFPVIVARTAFRGDRYDTISGPTVSGYFKECISTILSLHARQRKSDGSVRG